MVVGILHNGQVSLSKQNNMLKVVVHVEVDQIQPEHSTRIVLGTSLITLQFDFVQTTGSFQIFNAGGVN